MSRDLKTLYANKKKTKVALFLPMSGKNANLGKMLYRSALISLFDNDRNHNLELILVDSMDNPIDTSQSFKKNIANKGIKVVIGPVFSKKIDIISRNVARYDIKLISLSNNQKFMDRVGEDSAIFLSGFLPDQQIDRIISHLQEQGINDFGLIAQNNSYGIEISGIIKKALKDRDATLIQSNLYNPSTNNLSKIVAGIVSAYQVPAEMAEGGGRKFEDDYRVSKSDKRYAKVIFVVGNAKSTAKISKLVKARNKTDRPIVLAGIGSWSSESAEDNKFHLKTIFATTRDDNFKKFEKSFYRHYKKLPPRISSIVYDSVSSVAQIVDRNSNRIPSKDEFVDYVDQDIDQVGFSGIDGNFRFLPNGLVQRKYVIHESTNDGFKKVSTHPSKLLKY